MGKRRWSTTEYAARGPCPAIMTWPRVNSRARRSAVTRVLVALPLLVGLLSVPVSCAMAAGPHSLFVSPNKAPTFVIHVHGRLTATSQGELVEARAAAVCPTPAKARPLPDPVTSVSALAAVMSAEADGEPLAAAAPAVDHAVPPPDIALAPHAPPPRV